MSRSKPVPPNEPKLLGTDELGFFVQMVTFRLQEAPPAVQERFWATIRKQCPQLLTAISASFTGEWGEITFTRSIRSAAFAPDDPDEEGHTLRGVRPPFFCIVCVIRANSLSGDPIDVHMNGM